MHWALCRSRETLLYTSISLDSGTHPDTNCLHHFLDQRSDICIRSMRSKTSKWSLSEVMTIVLYDTVTVITMVFAEYKDPPIQLNLKVCLSFSVVAGLRKIRCTGVSLSQKSRFLGRHTISCHASWRQVILTLDFLKGQHRSSILSSGLLHQCLLSHPQTKLMTTIQGHW